MTGRSFVWCAFALAGVLACGKRSSDESGTAGADPAVSGRAAVIDGGPVASPSMSDAAAPLSPIEPVEVPVPQAEQPEDPYSIAFVGWTEDGTRFVLDATYGQIVHIGPKDRPRDVVIRQVHDSLTGDMVDSYRRDGTRPSHHLALWTQAKPGDQWKVFAADNALVGDIATMDSSDGTYQVTVAIPKSSYHELDRVTTTMQATELQVTWTMATANAHMHREQVLELPPVDLKRSPTLVFGLTRGDERWSLVTHRMPSHSKDGMYNGSRRNNGTNQVATETVNVYWSPTGDRLLIAIDFALDVHDLMMSDPFGKFFVRAIGPQLRVLDGGAGAQATRTAATMLGASGVAVTSIGTTDTAPASKVYYRDDAGHALATEVAAKLGGLATAELTTQGWVDVIVVLAAGE